MENTDTNFNPPAFSIHPATGISGVSLTVADLQTQIRFYQQTLGFHLHSQNGDIARLGTADRILLQLIERPDYKRYPDTTGLYHFAILFPDQRELAKAVARLYTLKYPNSPTDHIMTKATYLNDPERNGIELYAESPEDGEWFMEDSDFYARRTDGTYSNGREPLDLEALFSHLSETDTKAPKLPQNTRIGHIHLHVRNIPEALNFYHHILGFDIKGNVSAYQMAFVSAGGYHHHIGLNTWQGVSAPPPPKEALGLRYFSIQLPDHNELGTLIERITKAGIPFDRTEMGVLLHDPSQNGVVIECANP